MQLWCKRFLQLDWLLNNEQAPFENPISKYTNQMQLNKNIGDTTLVHPPRGRSALYGRPLWFSVHVNTPTYTAHVTKKILEKN